METQAKKVIRLKVISMSDGSQLEKVRDVIYDPKLNKIVALIINTSGLFSSAKAIMFEDVKSIGEGAVMVMDSNVIKKASEISARISHIAKDDDFLTKTKVISEAGNDLGSVDDLAFDSNTGVVTRR